MNDDTFFREVQDLYQRIISADTDDFIELAKIANIDPKIYLKKANLQGLNGVMAKQISLEITSDWVSVGGSSYTTYDIDRTTKVGLKTNLATLFTAGRKFAVLMRHKHEYIVLVSSRDEQKIDQVVDALKNAIVEARRGNRSYSQVIQMNGDYVNMSGNFGSGFSKGEINESRILAPSIHK
jgi:hypothetical protein